MNKKESSTFKFLVSFIKPYKKIVIALLFVLLIISLLQVYLPLMLGKIIDTINDDTGVDVFKTIVIGSLSYFGLNLLSGIITVFYEFVLQKYGSQIVLDIRTKVFNHVENLSLDYFVNTPVGLLVSRITNDTNKLNNMYAGALINLVKNLTIISIMLLFIFSLNVKLALATVTVVPFLVIVVVVFKKITSKKFKKERKDLVAINVHLSENITGMYLTQAFNQESQVFSEFDEKNYNHFKTIRKIITAYAFFKPTIYILRMTGVILVLYFGSTLVLSNEITIGLLVTFIFYSNRLFEPLEEISNQISVIFQSIAAAENLKNILEIENKIEEVENPFILKDFKGKIEFKNVSFSYEEDEPVLKNVSFVIEPNKTLALVGATGSGKTTILKLINRYYDVDSGEIYIDDINITEISIKSLRDNIGQMLQDVRLFTGTIKENITLFDEQFSEERIDEVMTYLNAKNIIDNFDDGYQHLVKEKGRNFSSGQKQLISFARSLVHQPKLLILDEATANIDSESEVIIQEALYKMMNIGTMIIVAHRLSTIQHSDDILVLEKGEVVEIGNHQQLLKNKAHYYELYLLQYQKDECLKI